MTSSRMEYNGLRQYLARLRQTGELIEVNEFVNPVLEIAEITDRMAKQPGGGKALLFNRNGTDIPVLVNLMGSERRICEVLRCQSFRELEQRIEQTLGTLLNFTTSKKIRLLKQLWSLSRLMPVITSRRAPCQEIINLRPDLMQLPMLQCWPSDGGRFITLPVVHTRHPQSRQRNAGMYRMHCFDSQTTGMHWHPYKGGSAHFEAWKKISGRMPLAVTLGGDPIYTYCATTPLPENFDEYILAGFLRGHRVKMVRCITQDIEVPADADIVIEGYIDPHEEFRTEGPFGDHTGFYSPAGLFPVFHVTAITRRKDAVFPATLVGVPPQEDAWITKATERLFLPLLRNTLLPEINNINIPFAGTGHNLTIVQLSTYYPAQSLKTMHLLWGAGQMIFNKILILAGKAVQPDDYTGLARIISSDTNLAKKIYLSRGPLDILDHASENYGKGGKMCIDVTHSDIPPDNEKQCTEDYYRLTRRIPAYSGKKGIISIDVQLFLKGIRIAFVAMHRQEPFQTVKITEWLLTDEAFSAIRIFIFMDYPVKDMHLACWMIAANIDPARDVYFIQQRLVIDGTAKKQPFDTVHHPWPEITLMDDQTIVSIDHRWPTLCIGPFIPSPSRILKQIISPSDLS